jgi:hypothetical protein
LPFSGSLGPLVGWVERSETHHELRNCFLRKVMGFAPLNPSYESKSVIKLSPATTCRPAAAFRP